MREKTLKPWHGAAFFLLIMIVFFVVCVPLQSYFGLYGVAATEIILLILALLFAKVMGYSLRSLFPVHSPEGLPMLGTILMWISSYILAMVVLLIQYRLFPGRNGDNQRGTERCDLQRTFLGICDRSCAASGNL